MKRRSISVTKLSDEQASELLEHLQLTRELDKTQMQLEIMHAKQVKRAQAAGVPLIVTVQCLIGRDCFIAVRKSLRGQNDEVLYQVHRPRGISNEQMQHAVEKHLMGLPKDCKIRDGDLFEFE